MSEALIEPLALVSLRKLAASTNAPEFVFVCAMSLASTVPFPFTSPMRTTWEPKRNYCCCRRYRSRSLG